MITFFTTAKPFRGHSAIVQRNALQSWKLLHPDVEVILFGDEEGAAETCAELGLRHEPHVDRHESGLKYIHAMFDRASEMARYDVLCYVNCDIILGSDFLEAVQLVRAAKSNFLMVGRRWDTEITQPIDFSNPNWAGDIQQLAGRANSQRDGWWIDYFCFSRNLYHKQIPPFVIGRVRWDNWLVWKALDCGASVADASAVVMAIHQNHGYSYHPGGQAGVWSDELAQRNLALAGGWRHLRTILDANAKLTPDGLKPNRARYWHGAKRYLQLAYGYTKRDWTYKVWLPAWHFLLNKTRPLRARLGLRSALSRESSAKSSTQAKTIP